MNELVKRLSKKEHPVWANRPDKSVKALQERIDLNYVRILFEETGTEIGIKLDRDKCDFSKANFEKKTGKVHFEGALTLNYDKVKCIADISIRTMKGKGRLQLIENGAEYDRIINTENVV
ncbi:hypothetical protein QQ020_20675 [Fulvivirgaceae bacterium BMA12]|uniref:Uncharacterized protein n=1 Tax=Agaribacillus aureus TaxID=3051825 RepID=A0ABT8LA14_9BACT|nr:hypothetical protein [Fulvivirgaceae bacterium BMA12]